MLEARSAPGGFTVYDSEADEPIIKFAHRAEADELIAVLQIQEVDAELRRWTLDAVLERTYPRGCSPGQ